MDMMESPKWEPDMDKVPGHIAPSIIFTAFGLYGLLKTLKLSKQVPAGKTFADVYLPYKNLKEMKVIGKSMMTLMVAGILYHAAGSGIDFSLGLHICMYFTYFMVGLSCYLESQCKLPPDTTRAVLALSMLLAGFLWRSHGLMMNNTVDQSLHVCLGDINMATAVAFGASVVAKRSMTLHLAGWALLLLQGFWLWTISFYLWFLDIPSMMVPAVMCAETTVVTIGVLLGVAYAAEDVPGRDSWWGNNHEQLDLHRGDYEVLAKFTGNSTDENDGEKCGDTISEGSSGDDNSSGHEQDLLRVV